MTGIRITSLIALIAVACVCGCARTSKAPKEDSAAAKGFETTSELGTVYLYRLGRAVGAANATEVRVNGTVAGGMGPGTFFKWDLKPGKYTLQSSTKESSATVALDVQAGQLYFVEQNVRIGLSSGRVHMKIRDAATGQKSIQGKKLLVSAYVPPE